MKLSNRISLFLLFIAAIGCSGDHSTAKATPMIPDQATETTTDVAFEIQAEKMVDASKDFSAPKEATTFAEMKSAGWLSYEVEVPVAGRYRVQFFAHTTSEATCWIEDYIDNKDGRTYNVTGNIQVTAKDDFSDFVIEGSPFNAGKHKMKIHLTAGAAKIDRVVFTLMKEHQGSPLSLTQNMDGETGASSGPMNSMARLSTKRNGLTTSATGAGETTSYSTTLKKTPTTRVWKTAT